MNITQQQTDDLNAIVRIEIAPGDYQGKVESVLREYRRLAKLPGFRPGKVPLDIIRKQYGTAIKADEINKLLSDSLHEYIQKNKIRVLGSPLPKEKQKPPDIAAQDSFEFYFDLGLTPEFELKLSPKDKFPHYDIQVDDTLLEKHINDICKRYGQISISEESGPEDMLQGEFLELDEAGQPREEGIKHNSTIALAYIEEEAAKRQLIGLKVESKITLDPRKVSKGDADMAAMLGVKKEQLSGLSNAFQFRVLNIYRMKPAAANQELFDRVFGPGNVKSEAEFRQKVSDELKKMLSEESDRKLKKDIIDHLIQKTKINLPDEFLKRSLLKADDKQLTPDTLEKEYPTYSRTLRWQLIENKIIKGHSLKVDEEEAIQRAKELIARQLLRYGKTGVEDAPLTDAAKSLLAKQEEAQHIYDQLFEEKIDRLLKSTVTLQPKEVSYDDFVKLATAKAPKSRLFDNISKLIKL